MLPAAVLAVVVKAQGVGPTNAQLASVQKNLVKTESAGAALGATMTKTSTAMMAAGSRMQRAGHSMAMSGKMMMMSVSLPLVALGAASVKMSLDWERSMRLLSTQAGAGSKEVTHLSKKLLELGASGRFTQGPKEIAESMFHIESVGYRGAKALKTEKAAADLATVGHANLDATTNALVGVMKTGIKGTENMRMAIGLLNAGIGVGNLRMEDLNAALGTGFVSAARGVGLSLQDVLAALGELTAQGVPATSAATRLRMTFSLMAAPTDKAKKALKGIGLDSEAMAKAMRSPQGIVAAVGLLKEHLSSLTKIQQIQVLTEAFGGAKSGSTIVALVNNLGDLNKKYVEVQENAGNFNEKLKETNREQGVELERALSKMKFALVDLGKALTPVVKQLADFLVKMANWFSGLSDGSKKLIVDLGLLAVALGPIKYLFGNLLILGGGVLKLFGFLIGVIGKIVTAFSAETIAAEATTAANVELSTSYATVASAAEASAAAQTAAAAEAKSAQLSMMMPGPAVGGQMSLLATPASAAGSAEAGAAGTAASASFASKFGLGLAKMLPIALAAVGVANILSSVIEGDSKAAAYKTGGAAAGAIAGGIAGAFVGNPVLGAMIGGGLGSLLGGAIEGLFGGGGPVESHIEHAARQTAQSFAKALGRQQNALKGLSESHGDVVSAHKRVSSAVHEVKRAERQLGETRKKYGPTARATIRDELHLAAASDRAKQARHQEKQAEHLHGIQLQLTKRVLVGTAQSEKQRIRTTAQAVRTFEGEAKAALKNGAGQERLKHVQDELTRSIQANRRAHASYNKTLQEAANIGGASFVKKIRRVKTVNEEVAESNRKMFRQVAQTNHVFPNLMQESINAWKKQRDAAKGTQHGYEKVKETLGPFRAEAHRKLGDATADAKNWSKESVHGTDLVKGSLNTFAKELGISKVTFHASKEAHKAKRQKGGIVVPGSGTGDKVPLTAMVEPGEVVHVLNSRASKDRKKLATLERMNHETPRFQEGGAFGVGAALARARAIDKQHFPYVWGGGHGGFGGPYDCSGAVSAVLHAADLLEKPMVSGELSHYGAAGPGAITVFANSTHAFMKILGRYFGTSQTNPGGGAGFIPGGAFDKGYLSQFAVRHPTGAGTLGALDKVLFEGPPGGLTELGKGVVGGANEAAAKWAKAHMPGGFGGGDAAEIIQGMYNRQQLSQLWSSVGGPGGAIAHIAGAIAMAESGGNPKAHNASGATGLWQILGAVLPGNLYNPVINAKNAVKKYQDAGGFSPWEAYTNGAYQQFMQSGGLLELAGGGSIGKSIKTALHGIATGKHLPKYKAQLKKAVKRIKGIGISPERLSSLGSTTKNIEKFAEYAGNASTLTTQDELGNITQGIFQGRNEGEWLNEQLGSLLKLRREVIGVHGVVESTQLPRINNLLKGARDRLRHIRKAIREADKHKRDLERKIDEIERAQKQSQASIEREIKELERQLDKAQSAKQPNRTQIENIRSQIQTKRGALGNSAQQSRNEIKSIRDAIRDIDRKQNARHRVESSLTSSVIPALSGQQSGMRETLANLFGDGGEANGVSFMGIKQIQGLGGTLDEVPNPPPIGLLGGEVFTVQNRLREIKAEAERVKTGPTEGESEAKQLAEQLAEEWKKRYLVSQYQYGVMQAMPTVQQIAAPAFAMGGVMMAEVGEKGREIVAAPQGSRVIPSNEVNAALRSSGNVSLVIEHMEIHPDGTATAKVKGKEFGVEVRKVTRKDTLKSMSRTPGGRGIKR